MFHVYFARGYANEQKIADCTNLSSAKDRADEEFANGARDIQVFDSNGQVVYEPVEQDYMFY